MPQAKTIMIGVAVGVALGWFGVATWQGSRGGRAVAVDGKSAMAENKVSLRHGTAAAKKAGPHACSATPPLSLLETAQRQTNAAEV